MSAPLKAPDDDHYAKLPIQPIEIGEKMVDFWPIEIIYHLTESLAAIMRIGSKGDYTQWSRDLKKAAWFLTRAAGIIEKRYGPVPDEDQHEPVWVTRKKM